MSVTIDVEYLGDLCCRATHAPSSQTLHTEAPVDNGGKGGAFSPTDLLATALGSCLVTIMGIAAGRRGWNLTGTRIRVVKEMTSAPRRRVGALSVTVTIPRGRVTSAADRRLLEVAAELCPVRESLHPDINLTMTFDYDGE